MYTFSIYFRFLYSLWICHEYIQILINIYWKHTKVYTIHLNECRKIYHCVTCYYCFEQTSFSVNVKHSAHSIFFFISKIIHIRQCIVHVVLAINIEKDKWNKFSFRAHFDVGTMLHMGVNYCDNKKIKEKQHVKWNRMVEINLVQ